MFRQGRVDPEIDIIDDMVMLNIIISYSVFEHESTPTVLENRKRTGPHFCELPQASCSVVAARALSGQSDDIFKK